MIDQLYTRKQCKLEVAEPLSANEFVLLDDSVKLVTLIGSAGTGKTLLSLASGMTKPLNEQVYHKMVCVRPIMPLGRDIGLPGRWGFPCS